MEGISKLIRQINTHVVGKDKIVQQSVFALLMGEHQLIFGSPGTAKSMIAELILQAVDDKPFKIQLSKYMDDSNLFGIINLEKFKKGVVERNYKNTILDSKFAFIDELFDANDNTLRLLLQILNERRFHEGNFSVENLPLKSVIATTNFLRKNDVTEAVIDRFLFKAASTQIEYEQLKEFKNLTNDKIERLELETVQVEFAKVKDKIEVPEGVFEVMFSIREKYNQETGEKVSDRRFLKTIDYLKLMAFMQDKDEVELIDLMALEHVWTVMGGANHEDLMLIIQKEIKSPDENKKVITKLRTLNARFMDINKRFALDINADGALSNISTVRKFMPQIKSEFNDILDELQAFEKAEMNNIAKKEVEKLIRKIQLKNSIITSQV